MKPIAIGRDIKLCGALFLLVGLVDVLLIEFYPAYPSKCSAGRSQDPTSIRPSYIRPWCIF